MPFHVEVNSGHQHARLFNLGEVELRGAVLEPWVAGASFDFGEHEWDPRESRLTILEGPEMKGPDLAFGQGWSNAQRAAKDVTRRLLETAEASAPVRSAGTIAADSLEAALQSMREGSQPQPIHWSAALERIDGRDPEVTAVILVVRPPAADRP